ncbi:YfhO family protein [Streptomyces sp. NBC_01306]|uniref:YfhO family protein n=1 Tax=Streptomyces sp. NBC_01306 TaxID=2903819 RepID=UPI00224E286A|nr:YfhO family protein [Streptomyces sp. NBC_01306]MCX4726133.1 YfhO family protein [Streptomyces sp. NBC_01306]
MKPRRPAVTPRLRATVLATLLTVLAVCTGDAAARIYPYGPRHRSISDLGNQYIPFHAHLQDLLHGSAHGGLLLNWQSGYGTSFLPDLGTYLSSPFALLVAAFPKDRIDLAVYLVTLLKMAAAAAAMTSLLLTLRPGRWWAAGLLGASYALCGWSVLEASYNLMWLDGLVAFPLLCLVGEWVRGGRRPLLGPVVVALAWTANFYTAYMATIGAALVLLVRLLLVKGEAAGAHRPVRVLLRAAGTVLLGIGLAAPLLFTVFLGTRHAYPGWTRNFAPASWTDVFARTLPATYSFSTPALFLGAGTLLLVCALAFHRAVPRRERAAWTGLVVLVALSMQWKPTHLIWHVFATPNGSPYRQTFVLSGLLVIAAWTALSYGVPGGRALTGGAAVLAAGASFAALSRTVTVYTYPLLGLGLAAAVGGLVLLGRAGRVRAHRWQPVVAALLLVGAQAGQAAATTAYADRVKIHRLDDYAPWGRHLDEEAAAVAGADDWPRYRTDPGREQTTGNDPLLVGGEGGSYYSSMTPDPYTRTMAALGAGWTSRGRSMQSLDNPVTDAIFSVGARVRSAPGRKGAGAVTVTREAAPPLVTVRPPGPVPHFGRSPFRNQELLLGAHVYTDADRCPAGTDVFYSAPDFTGFVRLGSGEPVELRGGQRGRRAALQPMGRAPGGVAVTPHPHGRTGCLSRTELATAVRHLTETGATSVRVTDDAVRAQLPPGSRGTAVFAMPRISGWQCRTGHGADHPARSYLGLVAVPLTGNATAVSCTFRPPGLRIGSAVGGLALALLVGAAVVRRVRRRGPGRAAAASTAAAGPPLSAATPAVGSGVATVVSSARRTTG